MENTVYKKIQTKMFVNNWYKSYHTFEEVYTSIQRFGKYESPFSPMYGGKKCYFYNPQLAFFLTSSYEFKLKRNGNNVIIRGIDYYKYYEQAFYEGEKHFRHNYHIPANKVHSAHNMRAIERIFALYIARGNSHENFIAKNGWRLASINFDLISVWHISNTGFYAGMCYGFFNMNNDTAAFDALFDNLDKRLKKLKKDKKI